MPVGDLVPRKGLSLDRRRPFTTAFQLNSGPDLRPRPAYLPPGTAYCDLTAFNYQHCRVSRRHRLHTNRFEIVANMLASMKLV